MQTSPACPAVWEAETLSGRRVRIHYRWGQGRVAVDGKTVRTWEGDASWDGILDEEDMLACAGLEVVP